jgi:hypothetical protein
MILAGKKFELILTVVCIALAYLYMKGAERRAPRYRIRKFPALEAIDEAVGRAAEMNRPVHYSTGIGGTDDQYAPMTLSGLAILGRVAEACGRAGVYLRYTTPRAYLVPVAQDILKAGYTKSGNPDMYSPDMVYYVGEYQTAFMTSVMGYILRERPAVNMIFGATLWETINQLGAGAIAGCIQLGGTPRLYYIPIMICVCDYLLIGEELYVAGAALEGTPGSIGYFRGQDLFKILLIVLFILAAAASTAGFNLIGYLSTW